MKIKILSAVMVLALIVALCFAFSACDNPATGDADTTTAQQNIEPNNTTDPSDNATTTVVDGVTTVATTARQYEEETERGLQPATDPADGNWGPAHEFY